jgi:predicted cupin superfamily sugar epimerase
MSFPDTQYRTANHSVRTLAAYPKERRRNLLLSGEVRRMHSDAARLVRDLTLLPHPEGGFYRELFRSPHTVMRDDGRERAALTVIYFLLTAERCSTWHRLASDETWHFAMGHALEIETIDDGGRRATLGLGAAGPWQATIPAGSAFAARITGGEYALVTCCVAPGFVFEDFELLAIESLMQRYPQHAAVIARYRH